MAGVVRYRGRYSTPDLQYIHMINIWPLYA